MRLSKISRNLESPVTLTEFSPCRNDLERMPVTPIIVADAMRHDKLGLWGVGDCDMV